MKRAARVSLLALYLLQAVVLSPLHERAEMAPAAEGPGLVLRAACDPTGPCPDPQHHHHPGDPHRSDQCATCAVAGRVALLERAPAIAGRADIVLALAPVASIPSGTSHSDHPSPRGPPASFSA